MIDTALELRAGGELEIRNESAREIVARLFTYGEVVETEGGPEMIERGALEGLDMSRVVYRLDHEDPARGRMVGLEDGDEGPTGIFRIARTPAGDEALQLASRDGDDEPIYRHVSIGFTRAPYDETRTIGGRRVGVRRRLDLREVSQTWRPIYESATITAIRAQSEVNQVPESIDQTAPAPVADAIPRIDHSNEDRISALLEQLETRSQRLEDLERRSVDVPLMRTAPALSKGKWAQMALRLMDGERIPETEMRALDDVITTGNAGVVPTQVRSELIGIINPARPFLQSTKEVPAGDSGLEMQFPRIVTRPTVGLQATEKAELSSQATVIDTVSFTALTKGGAGDLSMQLLKRSSPSFLELWLSLLAEAYAVDTDNEAVDALLAQAAVVEGGILNPASLSLGGAFTNAVAVSPLLLPDRMWLSTAGLAAFIDAKTASGGAGVPMYPGLVKISGVSGDASNGPMPISLTPVHVPALDDEAPDVIVGPSRGFAWAEDGTYTLQADVPSKFGRDVGIAGMIWFMPIYPAAFTSYTLS